MPIDIDHPTEAELVDLNHRIVVRSSLHHASEPQSAIADHGIVDLRKSYIVHPKAKRRL